ncbi:MAG: response regulator transcription factor [Kiloniellales bacterium]
MKVLIADDHDLIRDTLQSFLENDTSFSVVQADSYDSAREKISSDGPFDIVLLDLHMPGMRGVDTLKEAMALNQGQPVALMSGMAPRSVAEEALAAGAAGFLPKTLAAKSLMHAIHFMAAGEQYAPIKFMTEREEAVPNPIADKLSERELQVLEGLCRGLSNKEIARELELQEVTVKLHVKTLCRKLEARNRTQAAMIARDAELF